MIDNKIFLFNFSSSYSGGGLKRLLSFSEWFDNNGGAVFIVHVKSKPYLLKYKNNTYFYINLSKFKKGLNNHNYLSTVVGSIGDPYLYYSYGIPIPIKVGTINWFHLSNVLPLISHSGYGLTLNRSLELKWLGILIRKGYKYSDVLSAESNYSLQLLPSSSKYNKIVSANGSDKEIKLFGQLSESKVNDIAVIVGTFSYKDLEASYGVFMELKEIHKKLKMVIVGVSSKIPNEILRDKEVIVMGELRNEEVVNLLSSAKFYINTSKVENSWNAASEGVLLANESFLSTIEPHLELVKIIANNKYIVDGDLIRVKRKNISVESLMVWSDIIQNMNKLVKSLK